MGQRSPNIHGVKDSAVDPILHFDLIHRLHDTDFTVLNGCEFFVGASILMGGDGGLLGICNVCPKLCRSDMAYMNHRSIDWRRPAERTC